MVSAQLRLGLVDCPLWLEGVENGRGTLRRSVGFDDRVADCSGAGWLVSELVVAWRIA